MLCVYRTGKPEPRVPLIGDDFHMFSLPPFAKVYPLTRGFPSSHFRLKLLKSRKIKLFNRSYFPNNFGRVGQQIVYSERTVAFLPLINHTQRRRQM